MPDLKEYAQIVGQSKIDDLHLIAEKLQGKLIQHINSTAVGGGVAEILNRMVPLLREINVNTRWDLIKGGDEFFQITKKFHNLLHGKKDEINSGDFEKFIETNIKNMNELDLCGDIIFVHDPQPIALVMKKYDNKWIWRCHVDVSNPDPVVWQFLMNYITKYDSVVFSAPSFSNILPIRQFLIAPSIDPLSEKNRELSQDEIDKVLDKYQIPQDKPIITQISRFDKLKDPLGVIEAYSKVKRYVDCRLLLCGGGAADDPEGTQIYLDVLERAKGDSDIHVLLMQQNDLEINALQRASTVIIQKSLKEGFGLTVAEALWKKKAVVASNVGGIPLQVKHKYSGLLCHSIDGAAFAIKQFLNSPSYAKQMGENGHEHIKNNYLLTRHIKDYMLLFLSLYYKNDVVYL